MALICRKVSLKSIESYFKIYCYNKIAVIIFLLKSRYKKLLSLFNKIKYDLKLHTVNAKYFVVIKN